MRSSLLFASLATLLAAVFGDALAQAQTISKIRDIRRLTATEADEGREVDLRAIVTYCNPARRTDLVVQDSTGGVFIGRIDCRDEFFFGDELEITGRTYWGEYIPMVEAFTILPIDRKEMPPSRDVTYDQVMSGNEIGQWVRIAGIVHSAHVDPEQKPPRLLLDVAASGARFRTWALDYQPEDAERLVDAEVTVQGVPAALSNNDGRVFNFRLLVTRRSDIAVTRAPPEDPFSVPPVLLQNLRQCRPDSEVEHRIRVGGTVAGCQPGQWVAIVDGIGVLQLRTSQSIPRLRPGDKIDAVGYPARGEYGAVLEDAAYRRTGERAAAPEPAPVSPAEALKSDSRLVSIDGLLLGMTPRADNYLLTLQSGTTLFETALAWTSREPPWEVLQPGSFVRVTGICTVSAGNDIRYLRNLSPQSFRIAMRDKTDLLLLRAPPWLTAGRAEIIMTLLGIAAVLFIGHYKSLHKEVRARSAAEKGLREAHQELEGRVEERSRQIEKEISARREAEGALRERNRLAAEIHDTFQQGLTALGAQLAIAGETLTERPTVARAGIEQARALVRYSQEEIRRTVWNLRSPIIEHRGLAAALEEIGRAMVANTEIVLQVTTEGEPVALPEIVQDHLLRIGQETLTNALKHGHPRRIEVRFIFRSRTISLSISDDGAGFTPQNVPGGETGHFGLAGMRERVLRLGGSLVVDAAPGAGAKVTAIVPLIPPEVMQD